MGKTFYFLIYSLISFICFNEADSLEKSDKYRPEYHFSISENWINDPNGMVYLDGEYHLFYQYHPFGTTWGPMHWGHTISTDLVHWVELPIALYPDELGDIFSGSAVADSKNSSGFQIDPQITPIIAIYTSAGQTQQQSIAYSNDRGRTFVKYDGNPVLPIPPGIIDFRDPKVIPYGDEWVMVLAVGDRIYFYRSTNLKSWSYLSEFGGDPSQGGHGGVWECPDLLKMTDENTGISHWVLLVSINPGGPNGGSVTQYFVGDFDGTNFISPDIEPRWLDWGVDNYAGVTFSNMQNGQNVLIGWMNNWDYANNVPTEGWRGQMTLPRALFLKSNNFTGEKPQVVSEVVPQIKTTLGLENQKFNIEAPIKIFPNEKLEISKTIEWNNPLLILEASFSIADFGEDSSIAICFMNNINEEICTGFDNGRDLNIFLDRDRSGDKSFSDRFHVRPTAKRISSDTKISFIVYMDTSAVEVFVDGGVTAMTALFYPTEPLTKLEIRHHAQNSPQSRLFIESLTLNGMASARM